MDISFPGSPQKQTTVRCCFCPQGTAGRKLHLVTIKDILVTTPARASPILRPCLGRAYAVLGIAGFPLSEVS